jgi:hypothetical protein
MNFICAHYLFYETLGIKTIFKLFLVPRKTILCEKILDEYKLLEKIQVGEFGLDLIPYDSDMISMELSSSFRDCLLEGDFSSLYFVARSIMKLQSFYGVISNVKAKGDSSCIVAEMIKRMHKQSFKVLDETPQFNSLILIDRNVDLITPMVK